MKFFKSSLAAAVLAMFAFASCATPIEQSKSSGGSKKQPVGTYPATGVSSASPSSGDSTADRARIRGELNSLQAQTAHLNAMIQFARTRIQTARQANHAGTEGEISAAESEINMHELQRTSIENRRTQLEHELLNLK